MAKVRSPNYPALDLAAALEAVRPALKAENRNKMSRAVLAGHMGYTSLNGRALGKIGAVRAYGLIDGSGDELRISDDAVTALMSPEKGGYVYKDALERLALKSQLFSDIKKQFPSALPSERNLAFWLVQQGFTQDAAGKASINYLATMRLVYDESEAYSTPPLEEQMMQPVQVTQPKPTGATIHVPPNMYDGGTAQETFLLDEGPVMLTFPAKLSAASYEDLEAHLQIFLRKAKRRAEAAHEAAEMKKLME